jgi:sugar transferase EpsL
MYRRYGKRVIDLCLGLTALLLLSPVSVVVAFCTWAALGAPILFMQERPGLRGKPFRLLKFRTMTTECDSDGHLLPDERRTTKWGEFLRSTSLDELPELFNVLTGKMSLVGPRPLLLSYVARYDAEQGRRHDVLPGITGWAQIHGRNQVPWPERLALDVWYADHLSLALDLRVLVLTIGEVIGRRGIHPEGSATMPEFEGRAEETPTSRASER